MSATSRARQKRHRERQRCGRVVFRIELPEVDLAHALVTAGWLAEGAADDRCAIEEALAAMLSRMLADSDA